VRRTTASTRLYSRAGVPRTAHSPPRSPTGKQWAGVSGVNGHSNRHAPRGDPGSAMCVQRFDDSLYSAIRITYRISLRSSSLREPRYPLLKVVNAFPRITPGATRAPQA
jgi:hypothetical protein